MFFENCVLPAWELKFLFFRCFFLRFFCFCVFEDTSKIAVLPACELHFRKLDQHFCICWRFLKMQKNMTVYGTAMSTPCVRGDVCPVCPLRVDPVCPVACHLDASHRRGTGPRGSTPQDTRGRHGQDTQDTRGRHGKQQTTFSLLVINAILPKNKPSGQVATVVRPSLAR